MKTGRYCLMVKPENSFYAQAMTTPQALDVLSRIKTSGPADNKRQRPKTARYWLEQLKMLDKDRICNILAKVPEEVTTPAAMQFAEKIILENRRSLLCALN
ncbi:hypothetical protein NX722_14720 [Endozoicomonas gorgoniicola]|uniref:Uncharacterized protein n=1 Tax=Endozoicomonas gorgoniicola TaxID=1234144 RepID=A0ABT3MWU4_9GAMM|nr:hypothetical protein [Endozoicomonas gorgoniicola]MCW7553856.1 hypothetical protein [Endozoicomonas gorgoniicola]